ncbi:hypothetical protein EON65_44035 [archaeon]|nr:MAG: hypothetical protein EON65_44035 [archaeon]
MLHPLENPQKEHSATIVMGRIVRFHVHESVLTASSTDAKPVVDWQKLSVVGRLGGDIFTLINNGRDIPRPEVSFGKADRR